ncbi:hypothetical protein GGR02_003027 [Anoxybacillus voinovskiensis]|uniref:Uncharacterized protein n=1 Tax=Anoxybacteroides voinovskiense TaxID=230470 RepID=A0A840DQC3_9BACL|nr:hypothetical protein [Anoxybacillus voinovskiensis]MBB4075210.1 hypothetical protein [Anoxybacillus voinovskiensis]GGJ77153.1 hypothetical protein GCM10008982_28150 [Anoxybacillus voinovskiensis]
MRNIGIHKALESVDWRKRAYFQRKFQIKTPKNEHILRMTDEEFLRWAERKTMTVFENWEQTDEYFSLYLEYMKGKMQRDLETVYDIVTEKAKQGDEKAVKLFLQLHSEVQKLQREMNRKPKVKKDESVQEIDEDDELEI